MNQKDKYVLVITMLAALSKLIISLKPWSFIQRVNI